MAGNTLEIAETFSISREDQKYHFRICKNTEINFTTNPGQWSSMPKLVRGTLRFCLWVLQQGFLTSKTPSKGASTPCTLYIALNTAFLWTLSWFSSSKKKKKQEQNWPHPCLLYTVLRSGDNWTPWGRETQNSISILHRFWFIRQQQQQERKSLTSGKLMLLTANLISILKSQ